jgi:4-cresol dehydrogenase (hydroxylating)
MISINALSLFFDSLKENQIKTDQSEACKHQLSKASFSTKGQVLGLIEIDTVEQTSLVLRLAQKHNIPIYPLSGGKNWGYGSSVPPNSAAVVLSLSGLNRICKFDSKNGVLTLEAGVNFKQVQELLFQEQVPWQLNAPGSTVEASVVGNTISRGLIQGPKLERWKNVISLEIVLPSGEIISTDQNTSKGTNRSVGFGPDLTPLFFQSNLGIVSKMKLQLDRKPACWQHLHLTWKESDTSLGEVCNILHDMKLNSLFAGSISVHNAEKILTVLDQYPWALSKGETPLPKELKEKLLAEIEGGDWFMETAISAPNTSILQAYQSSINEIFKSHSLEPHWAEANQDGPIFHQFTQTAAEQVYWRKKEKAPYVVQPEKDDCGILWYSPVIPWNSKELEACSTMVNECMQHFGFEPLLTFQFAEANYGYAIISILYDRAVDGEDQRALDAMHQLKTTFIEDCYLPYRLGINEQAELQIETGILAQLKKQLDPNNILAPGHYIGIQP